MVKQASKKDAAVKVRFLPAMVVGVLLLVAAGILWVILSRQTYQHELLQELPKDSQVAGVARLSVLTPDYAKQLATMTGYQSPLVGEGADFFGAAGVSNERLQQVFQDRFAFSQTPRGSALILYIKRPDQLGSLQTELDAKLTAKEDAVREGVPVRAGTLPNGTRILAAIDGQKVYVATSPELIDQLRNSTESFDQTPHFTEVSEALPATADGYVFINGHSFTPGTIGPLPLLGFAWNEGKTTDIHFVSAEPAHVGVNLPTTNGKLLLDATQAPVSVSAQDLTSLLRLLEEQRQDVDLPGVLRLQNGISSLSRTIGQDFEQTYLGAVLEGVTYGRFVDGEQKPQWILLGGFPTSDEASAKVTELARLLREKVTAPVRHEVVTILPDGTQSREVVSEGREPVTFETIEVETGTAQTVTLPGNIGKLYFTTLGKHLVVASSPEGIVRASRSIGTMGQGITHPGQLAMRVHLPSVAALTTQPDLFERWLYVLRPAAGRFELDKSTGVLTGSFTFAQ